MRTIRCLYPNSPMVDRYNEWAHFAPVKRCLELVLRELLRTFLAELRPMRGIKTMPELVKILAATAEIGARFDRPYIGLLTGERVKVFESLVTALLPFGFHLANTEIVASGNAAEER